MTELAQVTGLHVGRVLAISDGIVVAGEAAGGGVVMHEGRGPVRGGVAARAIIAAGDMVGGPAFRSASVMATETDTEHLVMIYPLDLTPGCGDMAGFAAVRGLYMGRALAVL